MSVSCRLPAEVHTLHKARRGARLTGSSPPCSCRLTHTRPLHSRAFPWRRLCTFVHTEPLNTLRGPQWSVTSQGVWETRTRTHSILGQTCPTLTSEPRLASSEPAPDHIGRSGGGPEPHKALWPTGKQASPLRTASPWALNTAQTLGSATATVMAIRVLLARATQGPPALCLLTSYFTLTPLVSQRAQHPHLTEARTESWARHH